MLLLIASFIHPMATSFNKYLAILVAATVLLVANAGDPDSLNDFEVPSTLDPSTITRQFFTFTGLRQLKKLNLTGKKTAVVTKVTNKEFPVLQGQSVSMAWISFPAGGINPPHIHPRGGEMFLVLKGTLEVGLVDTTNKLFVQTLQELDVFVFPKGLVHFQVNVNSNSTAVAIGIFGSSNAGALQLGPALFGSGIDVDILAKGFKTDEATISEIVKGFK